MHAAYNSSMRTASKVDTHCVKLWPLQRVAIIRFVTDWKAIEKSKMLHNKLKVSCLYFIVSSCVLNGMHFYHFCNSRYCSL